MVFGAGVGVPMCHFLLLIPISPLRPAGPQPLLTVPSASSFLSWFPIGLLSLCPFQPATVPG